MGVQLEQLVISNLRNLVATTLSLNSKFNMFVGPNGSGKTSLLEAVYLLGMGRSFRARSIQQIISFGAQNCFIRAKVGFDADLGVPSVWLGLGKDLNGNTQYKIGEQAETSSAALSKILPVQLIDADSMLLLDGGPLYRRQFMDWGVFHVEHSFLTSWRLMRRALEQRNTLLRNNVRPALVWDEAFVQYALEVNAARQQYMIRFVDLMNKLLEERFHVPGVKFQYHQGWNEGEMLMDALQKSLKLDLTVGYTNRGPHRADFLVTIDDRPAKTVLSRGQMKLFVCLMLIARSHMLGHGKSGLMLIDDLHAELDGNSCGVFVSALEALNCQALITGVEQKLLSSHLRDVSIDLFHVEHGCVQQLGPG